MKKQELLYSKEGAVTLEKYEYNIRLVPSSATATVYSTAGEQITSGTCTVSATGIVSFSLSATYTGTLGENFRCDFVTKIGGVEYYDSVYFDVVKKVLKVMITDDDLKAEYSSITRLQHTDNGTVKTATNKTTFTTASFTQPDNFYKGGALRFMNGDNIDFTSKVAAYTEAGQIVLVNATVFDISAGDVFTIRKSFTSEIDRSFDKIKEFFRSKGNRPSLILDDTSLINVNICGALMLAFLAAGEEYRYQYEEYKDQFNAGLNSIVYNYDLNENLIVETGEKDISTGITMFRR
jgi:hypothetical protein